MRIDILTLFPEMCDSMMNYSILGRAMKKHLIEVYYHQIREYTHDKHKRVDDSPYGGGKGMLLLADPIFSCFQDLCRNIHKKPRLIYMSPRGNVLTQKKALELSQNDCLAILCGHYEGVDERVIDEIVDEEISIGDYVLTGGELPALVLVDAICRLIPGVLSDKECFEEESHFKGLLEYPQYTRPFCWHGRQVPSVLLSGHHAKISNWRRQRSLLRTAQVRPDLVKKQQLSDSDRYFLENRGIEC